MTKILNFGLKIKGGGREGGTCEVLRPCHPPKKKFEKCTDTNTFYRWYLAKRKTSRERTKTRLLRTHTKIGEQGRGAQDEELQPQNEAR